jgi:hypothetical protein
MSYPSSLCTARPDEAPQTGAGVGKYSRSEPRGLSAA